MIGPVIGHIPCDLATRAGIRRARYESLFKGQRKGRGTFEAPPADLLRDTISRGEDVWRALRF